MWLSGKQVYKAKPTLRGSLSLVHKIWIPPYMCLMPAACLSIQPWVPSEALSLYRCYRLCDWLSVCVSIFYKCTVYIAYVYIGVYYVYRHVAMYPESLRLRVTKVKWCGGSTVPQQEHLLSWIPFSLGWAWPRPSVSAVSGRVLDWKGPNGMTLYSLGLNNI